MSAENSNIYSEKINKSTKNTFIEAHPQSFSDKYYLILVEEFCNIEKYPFLDIINKQGKALSEQERFDKIKKNWLDKGNSEEEAIEKAKKRLIFIRRRFFRNRAKSLVKTTSAEKFEGNVYKITDDVGIGQLMKSFTVKNMEGMPISFVSRIFFQGDIKEASVMESITEKLGYENRIRELLTKNEEIRKKKGTGNRKENITEALNVISKQISPVLNKVLKHAKKNKDRKLFSLINEEYNDNYEKAKKKLEEEK